MNTSSSVSIENSVFQNRINKNCFDFLRMFFAFNILLAHLSVLSQNSSLVFILKWVSAHLSIQGFFVISGFLVSKSYLNTDTLKKYFIKRIKRIIPAYAIVILLAAIGFSVLSTYSLSDYYLNSQWFKYIGWNLVFLNFMQPCLPGLFEHHHLECAVNGSLWTLKVEEGFYLVLPVIFFIISRLKNTWIVLIVLYISSILFMYLMEDVLAYPLIAKQLPGYICYFVTGTGLYLGFEFFIKHQLLLFLVAVSLLIISYIYPLKIDFLFPASFGTLVILSAYNIPFLNHFGKYGDFTYGLYIYHYPIIQTFRELDLFDRYNPFVMSGVIILLSIIFALLSWFLVEKRFLDRYHKVGSGS